MQLIAQGFGIFGMLMNVLSYQCKTQRKVIFMQLFGSMFFAINFYMLGAYMGALLNAIGVVRAVIYSNKNFFKAEKRFWLYGFTVLYIISYFSVFAVFKKEVTVLNLLVELLPLIAMIAATISFSKKDASVVRKYGLISSPCWLIYNCVNFAIGAIFCEIFILTSIIIALFRLDRKPNK
ncbi:MAG: YgjV family protein [Ruminococcaceae bacterium]|nr:YgjV family protein [Oscillospiraceae bacterium]